MPVHPTEIVAVVKIGMGLVGEVVMVETLIGPPAVSIELTLKLALFARAVTAMMRVDPALPLPGLEGTAEQ